MVKIEWVLNIPDGITCRYAGIPDTLYIDIQKWFAMSREEQLAVIEHEKLHILAEKNRTTCFDILDAYFNGVYSAKEARFHIDNSTDAEIVKAEAREIMADAERDTNEELH